MRILAVALISAAILSQACSSGGGSSASGDRVLHLRTGDFTEQAYRTEFRVSLASDDRICPAIRGLSIPEIVDFIDAVPASATPTVNAVVSDDDKRRVSEIVQEECDRIDSP